MAPTIIASNGQPVADMVYESKYKFDVHPSYRSRNMWIHKDICRFHGDETRVAETQNITPLCVDDRVEIAVNLFNAKGMVDIPSPTSFAVVCSFMYFQNSQRWFPQHLSEGIVLG